MTITRYTAHRALPPWRELDTFSHRLGRFFDEPYAQGNGSRWAPSVDVEEDAEAVVLTAELPGLKREDVEIELENNVLTIRGQKASGRDEASEERRYHVWERRWGSFQRSFRLPRGVGADVISAAFSEGVLTVTMPKAAEARGRRIEIGEP